MSPILRPITHGITFILTVDKDMTTTLDKNTKKIDLVSQIINFRFAELSNKQGYLSIIVLIVSAIYFIEDLYVDLVINGEAFFHVLLEGSIFLAISLALAFEVRHALKLASSVSNSQEEVKRLKKHLNEIIHDEFSRWNLTKTEKEIAIMLIKGFSMQEIADIRNVKEKSVRQQATGIYSKANLSNRYELTSHFIEDLLAPTNT